MDRELLVVLKTTSDLNFEAFPVQRVMCSGEQKIYWIDKKINKLQIEVRFLQVNPRKTASTMKQGAFIR